MYKTAVRLREAAVDAATSSFDEEILEKYFEGYTISDMELLSALRKSANTDGIVPVVCGSSVKGVGVHGLLDAMVDLLPAPQDRPLIQANILLNKQQHESSIMNLACDPFGPLCALAFKVVCDLNRGPIVFLRVFSGTLSNKDMIRISRMIEIEKGKLDWGKERVTRLFELHGGEWNDLNELPAGGIGAIVGCKHTRTGDTITHYKKEVDVLELSGLHIPEPVFSISIEPKTRSDETHLLTCLQNLSLEDPSVRIVQDPETGQRLIQGMGELHLEIVQKRLFEYFKVKARIGKIRVAYRESIEGNAKMLSSYQNYDLGKQQPFKIEMFVSIKQTEKEEPHYVLDQSITSQYSSLIVKSLRNGIHDAFIRGSTCMYPLSQLFVRIHSMNVMNPSAIDTFDYHLAAAKAVTDVIQKAGSVLLEPFMKLEIRVPESYEQTIVADLSTRRRGIIYEIDKASAALSNDSIIFAKVPVAELIGYSKALRALSQGTAQYAMTIDGYNPKPSSTSSSSSHQSDSIFHI
jgi:elongation factor G